MENLSQIKDNKEILIQDIPQKKPSKTSFDVQNRKVLFWDIDGTLMHSTRAGAYKEYFVPVLQKVYGSAGKLNSMVVSGMTDTQIAFEALREEGFTIERIFAQREQLLDVFHAEMSRVIAARDNPYEVFPGVPEILAETQKETRFHNVLLTGNLSVAAQIKLQHVDLWKYFENAPNIFGEVSHDRRELARYGVTKVNEFLGAELNPEQFIVIGDTPNDIACARAVGAKVVAVATGRNHPREELLEYKPDILLDDLSDTKQVLETFDNL